MKMRYSVFLVGTEHQLFQVKRAIDKFKLINERILLVVLEVNGESLIRKIEDEKEFDKVVVFQNWIFEDILRNRSKPNAFIKFCNQLKENYSVARFFTSHYDSDPDLLFLSIVNPPEYYLMDEGTASFMVVYRRCTLDYRKRIQILIKSILYLKVFSLPTKLTFFTQYNLNVKKEDTVIKYQVEEMSNSLTNLIREESIFVGTGLVEVNMMKESVYLALLRKVYEGIKYTKCYYYPHRKESIKKLQLIEQMGFVIKRIDEPFESMFAKQNELPGLCCSFFTTGVLYNIAKSNKTIPELRIYKFDLKTLLQQRKIYEQIYIEMQSNKRLKFIQI